MYKKSLWHRRRKRSNHLSKQKALGRQRVQGVFSAVASLPRSILLHQRAICFFKVLHIFS